MGILDNLEAYWENMDKKALDPDKCIYCDNESMYTQIGQVGRIYRVVDVCKKHFIADEPS